jgi:membrane protein required for colicin V production
MNGFDLALIAIVAFSALFAFARGIVRELIALATWVAALIAAFTYSGTVANWLSGLDMSAVGKHVLAFALILIAVLVAGALLARTLSSVVKAIGLGFVDRLLGAVFGVARGIALVVLFALVAGVTMLPKQDWWQNAMLGRSLAEAALALKPYLPRVWAERLDFSAPGTISAGWGRLDCTRVAGSLAAMCGIVGVVAHTPVNRCSTTLCCCCSTAARMPRASSRATGRRSTCTKAPGYVRDVFRTRNMRDLTGNLGIGHCRYPTAAARRPSSNRSRST